MAEVRRLLLTLMGLGAAGRRGVAANRETDAGDAQTLLKDDRSANDIARVFGNMDASLTLWPHVHPQQAQRKLNEHACKVVKRKSLENSELSQYILNVITDQAAPELDACSTLLCSRCVEGRMWSQPLGSSWWHLVICLHADMN